MARKIFGHFVVVFMILILIIIINGKWYFSRGSGNIFLFIYGITVTSVVLITFLIAYLGYKDPVEIIRAKGMNKNLAKPLVSCILAVYNEEDFVSRCVNSLLSSTYKNKEIIIVNDASTDKTMKVLEKEFGHNKQVQIINLKKNIGKKRAIAQGIKIAKGNLFVFTDSDSVVAPDAIGRIIEIFVADPLVGAVSGHGRALNARKNFFTKMQDSWYETQFSIEKAVESVYGAVTCVSGPLAVFRRESIYNYIPAWENDSFLGKEFKFATDRQLTGYVLGSNYVGAALKKKYADSPFVKEVDYPTKNWKVLYCKSAKVWTVVPETFSKIIKQHIRWKKSFIRNLFFTGSFYWRKPVVPALKFYLGALFTILGPFIALRHIIYLPLQGNILSAVYYLSGIIFVGSLYAVAFKLESPNSTYWYYRPFMSVLSTLVLSWLIFYSALTIRNPVWHRG